MRIPATSWQFTDTVREALFDELTKISEASALPDTPRRRSVGKALQAMAVGAGGGALGYGLAEVAGRKIDFLRNPNEQRARVAKIILPILSGTAVMLADRYRQKMNEQYAQVEGFKRPEDSK